MTQRALAVMLILSAAAQGGRAQEPVVFPAGTRIPVRFLHGLASGRDTAGTPVLLQTFGALVDSNCVVVPAYTHLMGHVFRSIGGRHLGRGGELVLVFDSLEVHPAEWIPLRALLDTLEYEPGGSIRGDSGTLHAPGSSAEKELTAATPAAAEVGLVPAAILSTYLLIHHGPRARILAGEAGAIRLATPLAVTPPKVCAPVTGERDLIALPDLPAFLPYTTNKQASRSGDPINFLLIGSAKDLDQAFTNGGWLRAGERHFGSVASEVTAAVTAHPAVGAPVSTKYFAGRPEDVTYEISGPNARVRHHIRIWLLDTLAGVWVGAANEDVGLSVNPFKGRATHKVDPMIDKERDFIVRTLEAGRCADLVDFTTLPGAAITGRNAEGQRYMTDGRAAVMHVRPCDSYSIGPE